MGHIEETKHLSADRNTLWTTVSDLRGWAEWFTIHEKWIEEPPAEITVGTTLVAKIVMLGMANKIEWTVKEIDAPGRLVLAGTGMAGVQCEFTFTITDAADGGTDFTVSGDFDGAMIKGALGKAVEKDGAVQLDATLQKLDELAAAKAA
ncbi:SRPBCC family protein [Nocardia sp. NPDC059180]|uniref:type II toxin-antitoxin system Rv0910 family toxin n=1 Tax=Nocardia sp. NPDC059180 TaxID=3346761 RepID=UPI0036CC91B2